MTTLGREQSARDEINNDDSVFHGKIHDKVKDPFSCHRVESSKSFVGGE